mmetsp:Transcript_23764/g.34039  ORF Transcript_23764/g.34039 Transcript_23764/m.34039 type:complete len:96 (-) Transcript_23764:116-403(-)
MNYVTIIFQESTSTWWQKSYRASVSLHVFEKMSMVSLSIAFYGRNHNLQLLLSDRETKSAHSMDFKVEFRSPYDFVAGTNISKGSKPSLRVSPLR